MSSYPPELFYRRNVIETPRDHEQVELPLSTKMIKSMPWFEGGLIPSELFIRQPKENFYLVNVTLHQEYVEDEALPHPDGRVILRPAHHIYWLSGTSLTWGTFNVFTDPDTDSVEIDFG